MQTLSIRIPDEDFQWLLMQSDGNVRTPSEKLRSLLQQAREQQQGLNDPERCAARMRQLVQPFIDEMGVVERERQMHSDLLAAVAEQLPGIMALLVAGRPAQEGAAGATEALVAQRCFRLFASLLKGAIVSNPAVYASGVYDRHLPDIIELAEIISSRKGKETNHG